MQHGVLPHFETRLAREVHRLVTDLGTSRRSVASALEAAGVRAAPDDAARSPVAIYLGAVIGSDPKVKSVRTDGRTVVVELRAWWRPAVTVVVPTAVREFTAAFDARCYPALLCRDDQRRKRAGRTEGADRADPADRADRGDADGEDADGVDADGADADRAHRVPGPARSAPRSRGRETSGRETSRRQTSGQG